MPLRVDPDHPCLWSQALMLSCVSTRVMWRSQQLQLLKICKELHSFCFVETRTWNDVQWDLCNQEWRCITAMLVITDNGGRWLDNCTRKVEDDWVGTVKLKPPRGIICIHLWSLQLKRQHRMIESTWHLAELFVTGPARVQTFTSLFPGEFCQAIGTVPTCHETSACQHLVEKTSYFAAKECHGCRLQTEWRCWLGEILRDPQGENGVFFENIISLFST